MYLPRLSAFTLRSATVYTALKSIFIRFLSVQQVERLQNAGAWRPLQMSALPKNKPRRRSSPSPSTSGAPLLCFSLEELITSVG